MGLYQGGPANGGSIEQLHHKETDRDGAESTASEYSSQQGRGKTLVCITFFLELLILAGVIVLEYFLRWSKVFPIRKVNFTCTGPDISYSEDDPSFSTFAFNAVVPTEVVYSLSLCVPPFVMLIGEIAVWAFTEDNQKSIRVCCQSCNMPQVLRRLFRFVGVFVFGLVTLMIFVDVIKMITGRLRPNFLEVCQVNMTLCALNGNIGGDELCRNKDEIELRHARGSFPSLRSAMTAYAAIYLSIYIHGALRTRSVRVLRPFLSLIFTMLALLCGLTELGLNHNYWTDIVAGWAMGIAMAIYLGAFVLYNFREYVSEKKMIRLLHGFLVDHQLLNEITKDVWTLIYHDDSWHPYMIWSTLFFSGKLRLFPFPFHIPRAHASRESPYQKFEGIKTQNPPIPLYGEVNEHPGDKYKDRPTPNPGYQHDDQRLSHL